MDQNTELTFKSGGKTYKITWDNVQYTLSIEGNRGNERYFSSLEALLSRMVTILHSNKIVKSQEEFVASIMEAVQEVSELMKTIKLTFPNQTYKMGGTSAKAK